MGVESAGDKEHSEAVVVKVTEAVGDASMESDETVDGFGAAVARAVGVEVSEEFLAPGLHWYIAEYCRRPHR